ncbi:MAG: sodium:alanine symporter family protein [Pseudomonadales bacterium]|nr:sodium:alanine symporter family protein [Pseudomonadales bacterium]MDP4639528.1 sodium:alanine symporter family protein [Pseudomonadales bacterium]MDP4764901.1 sodium:alanine symporter family protein [Pseudomonadales bacterium]MDP4876317.1 sodium:alanine symporter family protein [Pseudomonadales bacterium]MDP4912144.1 sodium:alanine symporter family protein [Pseudomonadales bacterium]
METLTQLLNLLDSVLGSAQYFPFILLGTGLFFTIYLKFPQVRFFRHAWRIVRGKYDKPGDEGDATHFQALTTAISGTVGTGNIGGVALAIFLGGPAALFWMWMTAFLGMTTKFVEVTLSHKYRGKDANGHIVGGPMYVMERRLNMKWLAVVFAVATVVSSFGSGNMPQSNNIASGVQATFGVPEWLTGLVLASLLAVVILGGIRRIVKVAEKIVPFMAVIYLVGAAGVIITNIDNVIPSFIAVFRDAFTGSAATGGFLGATFAYAFNRGVNRGLFSNEAGQGSAPIAHAAAKADEPISEGMVSILEPFIDTIVICTVTGLVILSSGVWAEKFHNKFQAFDMEVVAGVYSESDPAQRQALFQHLSLTGIDDPVKTFSGVINVTAGVAEALPITIIHNRSVAEDVRFYQGEQLYTGAVDFADGKLLTAVQVQGRSLIHSVELTTMAFTRGVFGESGKYIVSIGLVLFAFSTAVAWSYYGDRAMTYLFGVRSVLPYRIVYVLGFFLASIADTSLIWLISAVTIALMTLPNLVAMLLLHREVKETIGEYWEKFHREHPEGV